MERIPCFIGAVIGGCLVMHVTGVQILISLLSSAPLAKRRHRKNPGFDLKKANRRILRISLIGFSSAPSGLRNRDAVCLCYLHHGVFDRADSVAGLLYPAHDPEQPQKPTEL